MDWQYLKNGKVCPGYCCCCCRTQEYQLLEQWYVLDTVVNVAYSSIGWGEYRGGEYCIVFTVCKSINSSFTEYEAELLRGLILIFCSFDKVANLARRLSLEISTKSLIFVICLYILSILLPFFQTLSQLIQRNISLSRLFNSFGVKYDVAIVILLSVLAYLWLEMNQRFL